MSPAAQDVALRTFRFVLLALVLLAAGFAKKAALAGDLADPSALPEPVRRYLAFAIRDGARPLKEMRMKLEGKVILPGQTEALEVAGEQRVSADRPAFDWVVKAKVNALITAHIRDQYEHGTGSILSKANGLVTLINDRDIAELNRTQQARWSGLAIMAPSAFLLKDHVTWRQSGPDSAEALVRDGKTESRHVFTFDGAGRLVRSESSDRWERYDGVYKQTGSIMERDGWQDVGGYMVPTRFRITRIEPDGSRTVFWQGRFFELAPGYVDDEATSGVQPKRE
ncbi:MAG: hypothetical protein KDJ73_14165 [Notoacmeibacter sp.]|nr:hypothetical protein [Notoacmeibacter sp.]